MEKILFENLPEEVQMRVSEKIETELWDVVFYNPETKLCLYYDADYLIMKTPEFRDFLKQKGYVEVDMNS
jgi:hypothetical protein